MITAILDLFGTYYQAGNVSQMTTIARSLLTAIPEDVVALQFLGLALYRMGRIEAARRVLARVAAKLSRPAVSRYPTTGELASSTLYREATSPASGLAEAWQHIAQVLRDFGFRQAAHQAWQASLASRRRHQIDRKELPCPNAA
jgi:tetratricopeptide (TPR) repeat protein